jgi:hypothetical protein
MRKEYDLTKMGGVLPSQDAGPIPVGKIPDQETQVVEGKQATNETVVVHTVTAGKTLYLSAWAFSVNNFSGVDNGGYALVTDGSDVQQYVFCSIRCPDADGKGLSCSLLPPLEIPAGYKIKAYSPGANITVTLFIHGYEA